MCRYHSRHDDWRQTKKKEGVHVPSEFSHEVIGSKKYTVRASRPSNRFDCSASRGSGTYSSPRTVQTAGGHIEAGPGAKSKSYLKQKSSAREIYSHEKIKARVNLKSKLREKRRITSADVS
jgi:hypothetical protein